MMGRSRWVGWLCVGLGAAAGLARAEPAPPAGPIAGPTAGAPRVLLAETWVQGVDPIVGRAINQGLAEGIRSRGYQVVGPEVVRAAMERSDLRYPPEAADLWRLMFDVGAQRAVIAGVWSENQGYVLRLTVASADGEGPYYETRQVHRDRVNADLEQLLAQALPAPDAVREEPPEPRDRARDSELGARYFATLEPPEPPLPRHRPLRLVLHGDTSFGIASDGFRNHGLGGRLDIRFNHETALGAAIQYQNLAGRAERAHSLLLFGQLENRVLLDRRGTVSVPLRFAMGYLARNGLFGRLSAGLGVNLGKRVDAVVELLTPTFWLTPEQFLFSLDLGVELGFKL